MSKDSRRVRKGLKKGAERSKKNEEKKYVWFIWCNIGLFCI